MHARPQYAVGMSSYYQTPSTKKNPGKPHNKQDTIVSPRTGLTAKTLTLTVEDPTRYSTTPEQHFSSAQRPVKPPRSPFLFAPDPAGFRPISAGTEASIQTQEREGKRQEPSKKRQRLIPDSPAKIRTLRNQSISPELQLGLMLVTPNKVFFQSKHSLTLEGEITDLGGAQKNGLFFGEMHYPKSPNTLKTLSKQLNKKEEIATESWAFQQFEKAKSKIPYAQLRHICRPLATYAPGKTAMGRRFVFQRGEGDLVRPEIRTTLLGQKGKLKTNTTVGFISYLLVSGLRGLQACQTAGLTHRDMKPDNLVAFRYKSEKTDQVRYTIKIIDFGLAGPADQLDSPKGSPQWLAPETAGGVMTDGLVPYTEKSDLFSLTLSAIGIITCSQVEPEWLAEEQSRPRLTPEKTQEFIDHRLHAEVNDMSDIFLEFARDTKLPRDFIKFVRSGIAMAPRNRPSLNNFCHQAEKFLAQSQSNDPGVMTKISNILESVYRAKKG